ncbi:MAG TPA: AAA family ATPase [Gaiellaceae bacterium]|nr:AAA family ATPase [Gaiellaceae bacterium]
MLVGRESEVEAIDEVLAAGRSGLAALIFEGPAGIGKTAVWQLVFERAAILGRLVLSCRPVEAESKLAFASLADLLDPAVDEALPDLAEPQRLALEVALLRAAPRGAPPDGRSVGTATRALLRRCAEATPIVVAIDDLQWLDRASASALGFALHRLLESPIAIVAAVRLETDAAADPLGLERSLAERLTRCRLSPLSLSGLYHVIADELGQVFPRPMLERIAEASDGNPLFALEIARAFVETEDLPGPGEPLPVPESLAALLEGRVRRLRRETRSALLAVAALGRPNVDMVGRALGREGAEALLPAERAGIVAVRDGVVRFSHPLLASTAYSTASESERRRVHRVLADILVDEEQRTRHLALATTEPDEEVAGALESAAAQANARGAPEVAAELAELACLRTPPECDAARAKRALALAEYQFRSGDTAEAQRLARAFVEEEDPGVLRARALELLARIIHVAGTAADAAACCEQALIEAGDDTELQARIHATYSLVSYHDFRQALPHARSALDLLAQHHESDPAILAQALFAYIEAEFYAGHPLPSDAVERALELERESPNPNVADRVSAALGAFLKLQGDFDGARHWLEATQQAAVEEGDDASLPYALSHLPQLELWLGNWSRAEEVACEHLELAKLTGQVSQQRQALYNLAIVHAHMGRLDDADREAQTLRQDAEAVDDQWDTGNAFAVLGFVELSRGDAAEAARYLGMNFESREAIGAQEPVRPYGDYVEALIELGDLDRAEGVLDLFEERSRTADRAALLAIAASCRALLAAARQDLADAAAAIDEALEQHARVRVPFDLARTLLVAGQVRRRRGERREARDALEEARRIFEELGAPPWVARAAAELRRIPIRRKAAADLTPTEERVAELAAAGRTNREVAQALFISPKTVEANLSRVYRKLGIHSRAELGARMAKPGRGESAAKQ